MPLTILAQITAAAGKEDLVRTELEKLVNTTRAEKGCLQYDLHADNETPGLFVFYATWEGSLYGGHRGSRGENSCSTR